MDQASPVALITGGAKRVGRAIVQRLADAGFDIAFTYLKSKAEADDLARSLTSAGRQAIPIRADLTCCELATKQIEHAVRKHFSRLNVLVNNASIYEPSSLQAATIDQMRRMWAIHAETPLLLCRAFEKDLRVSAGHIINMLDLLAERPWPDYLAYCASKAALWNLTLGLARELAPDVTVNGIAPGVVQWPDDYPEDQRQDYLRRVPLARPGTPADVAEAVLYFCTGGQYVTGQVLKLDGGRSLT